MTLVVEAEAAPVTIDRDGVARVGGSRVTMNSVIVLFQQGLTPEQIADDFDSLSLADIYSTVAFYLRHRDVVEEYLRQQREDAAECRRQIDAGTKMREMRERLMIRAAQLQSRS